MLYQITGMFYQSCACHITGVFYQSCACHIKSQVCFTNHVHVISNHRCVLPIKYMLYMNYRCFLLIMCVLHKIMGTLYQPWACYIKSQMCFANLSVLYQSSVLPIVFLPIMCVQHKSTGILPILYMLYETKVLFTNHVCSCYSCECCINYSHVLPLISICIFSNHTCFLPAGMFYHHVHAKWNHRSVLPIRYVV